MKEEIKEILDNLKYTAKKHTIQVLENGGKIEHCPQEIATEMRLNSYSANILLDYITNLQEENEKLKEVINDDMTVYIKGLEDGKEKMKQCFESIYKQRNEKAIEYINHENFKRNILVGVSTKKYTRDILNNVLNILKGDNND